jgi:hypothetical protein
MKIEFVPFIEEDLDLIEKRPENEEGEMIVSKTQRAIMAKNPSMTMLVDGIVKACGGCVYLWPNTAEFWAVTTPDIGKYRKVFNQFVLNLIGDVTKALNLKRLQASVREDFVIGHRWVKYLGFNFEAKMPKYIEDHTYWLYSKIVEE